MIIRITGLHKSAHHVRIIMVSIFRLCPDPVGSRVEQNLMLHAVLHDLHFRTVTLLVDIHNPCIREMLSNPVMYARFR